MRPPCISKIRGHLGSSCGSVGGRLEAHPKQMSTSTVTSSSNLRPTSESSRVRALQSHRHWRYQEQSTWHIIRIPCEVDCSNKVEALLMLKYLRPCTGRSWLLQKGWSSRPTLKYLRQWKGRTIWPAWRRHVSEATREQKNPNRSHAMAQK